MLEKIDIEVVVSIAKDAGDTIMKIYDRDFQIDYKDDKSPLTEADTKSNEIICTVLKRMYPDIPLLSEENKEVPYEIRKNWEYYWCIDPIDGTKEFIKKNGEFTVNIALIHRDIPVLGVVYVPALGEMYFAKQGEGAYKMLVDGHWSMVDGIGNVRKLPLAEEENRKAKYEIVVVASKSHLTKETQDFIDTLVITNDQRPATNDQRPTTKDHRLKTISKGSSLKLLMVAEGSADLYPRLAPTMEWDTAAADAIVRETGKMTYQFGNRMPLLYNKEDLLNPWFVVE